MKRSTALILTGVVVLEVLVIIWLAHSTKVMP
jgi:hypothetical protein